MLALAEGNAGAAALEIFEYPKLAMMPLCSCFARRVKSLRRRIIFVFP